MSPPCVSGRRRAPCTTRRSPPAQTGCAPTHPVRSGRSRRRPDLAARCASRDARRAAARRAHRRSAAESSWYRSRLPRREAACASQPLPRCQDADHRPARLPAPPAPRRRSGLVPRPTASECAISTCRHLTRSGMPPADTDVPSGSIASRSARYDSWARRYAAASSGSCRSRSVISRIIPVDSSLLAAAVNAGCVR